jgi:hypothetical protein
MTPLLLLLLARMAGSPVLAAAKFMTLAAVITAAAATRAQAERLHLSTHDQQESSCTGW